MPWIDFVSGSDRAAIWYSTNSPSNNVGSFDRSKPTIMMLHPLFLDSSWAHTQMNDPRLGDHYNIISIDVRSCGKSDARPNEYHDCWVDAADLAFAHQALQLPPVHLFAVSGLSCNTAMRFAALFPEKLASLTLVNACPPSKLEWVRKSYSEVVHMWCYPSDLDEFEHACLELSTMMLGDDAQMELRDELIAHWTISYPPWQKRQISQYVYTLINILIPTDDQLAAITTPTLIVQADKTHASPVKSPEHIAKKFVNVPGGAKVHTIRGAPEYVTVVPSCASIVNRILASFISQQPFVPSEVDKPPRVPTYERMQEALKKLAELSGDQTIATRDPRSPISFSLVSEEVRQLQLEALKQHNVTGTEFSPLGHDGRPLRKFSDRYQDHWFQEKDNTPTSTALISREDKEKKLLQLEKLVAASDETLIASEDNANSKNRSASGSKPMQIDAGHKRHIVRRSTVLKQTFEKASLGISDLPTMLITNTVPVNRFQ